MVDREYFELLSKRLDYIEEHLARLGAVVGYHYVPMNSGSDVPPGVRELARAGKAIQAIQLYRELTGVGLKEAKDVVDTLR
jgi:Ribosomal protein L7/L12 C-terminal domain